MRMNKHAEDGAVVVLVAVLAMVMFAAAAFALVAGQWWVAQRNIVTATDAAALAVAGGLATSTGDCGLADTYLGLNADGATGDCDDEAFDTATRTGYVTVNGQRPVPLAFGYPDSTATSMTSVQVFPPGGVAGVRPLAICAESLAGWDPESPDVIRIDNASLCEDASGNWGWLNLPGSITENIANGYPGTVRIGDPVNVNTGNATPWKRELEKLEGQTVIFIVFSVASGCGANAQYTVADFIAVEIVDVETPGNNPGPPPGNDPPGQGGTQPGPPENPGGCQGGNMGVGGGWDLLVRGAQILAEGECCGPDLFDSGIRTLSICAVTGTSTANCEP